MAADPTRSGDDPPTGFTASMFGLDPDDPLTSPTLRELVKLKLTLGIDFRQHPELVARCYGNAKRAADAERHGTLTDKPADDPVVYYVRVGALIKIGTAVQLKRRLAAYRPDAVLLATEPGSYDVERRRLRQFRDCLAHRKEWHSAGPRLVEHINGLRDQPLTASDLGV